MPQPHRDVGVIRDNIDAELDAWNDSRGGITEYCVSGDPSTPNGGGTGGTGNGVGTGAVAGTGNDGPAIIVGDSRPDVGTTNSGCSVASAESVGSASAGWGLALLGLAAAARRRKRS